MWKKGALATAVALAVLGAHSNADALALGAAHVQSALGEPLRAEVEVPEITVEEAATFQAALGTPQEFQTAGVDYSQALRGTRITLSHRTNGRAYLSVQGQQPVNEPFLTLVIDANWSGGHVVRDYTLLIDPPRPQAAASAATPTQQESAPAVTSAPRNQSAFSGVAAESTAASNAASAPGAGQQMEVQPGTTATAIVQAYPVEGVSLDQMLVALLRANPQAFIHGNVNLIRAGAVVNIPSADQAAAVSSASAHRMLIAQSHDFRAFRQGLAVAATHRGRVTAGRRSTAGNVQPQVQETNPAPAPQDRLTLSQGRSAGRQAAGGAARAETRLAQSRQAQEQAAREAELNRNIKELSQLAGASGSAAAASSTRKSTVPAIKVPASVALTSALPSKVTASVPAAGQRPASAQVPATTASAATSQTRPAPQRPVAPPPEPSLFDTLLDNWPMLAGLLAIIVLLGGYGVYRGKQKKDRGQTVPAHDAYPSSKLPPDSYFGASGGQRVDTSNDNGLADAGSSMAYSPSQLEAVGDVDPVSEADVYLAYGRDAQAEEILKEALRTYPGRSSIHAKLAEIYAKQHNTQQLQAIATEARRITHGEGRDWQAITALGHNLDPANPLYAPANVPTIKTAPGAHQPGGFSADLGRQPPGSPADPQNRLDLGAVGNAPLVPSSNEFPPYAPTVPASMPTPLATEPAPLPNTSGIDFSPPTPAQPQTPSNSGMMEFNISGLGNSLAPHPAQTTAKPTAEEPLATKLALAQEFHAIGDSRSARTLVKEVLAEATGALKTKAEQILSDLG